MSETKTETAKAAEEQQLQRAVYDVACGLYRVAPDWMTFYRNVFGTRGIVRRCYPSLDALAAFERTEVYAEIQQMLSQLRRRANGAASSEEATGVITIRLPSCVHDALRQEAYEHRTSMNKLCISKLIQLIDSELVPSDFRERGDPGVDV